MGKSNRALHTCIGEDHNNIRCGDEYNPVAAHCKKAGHSISSLRYISIKKVEKPSRGGTINVCYSRKAMFTIFQVALMKNSTLSHLCKWIFDIVLFKASCSKEKTTCEYKCSQWLILQPSVAYSTGLCAQLSINQPLLTVGKKIQTFWHERFFH